MTKLGKSSETVDVHSCFILTVWNHHWCLSLVTRLCHLGHWAIPVSGYTYSMMRFNSILGDVLSLVHPTFFFYVLVLVWMWMANIQFINQPPFHIQNESWWLFISSYDHMKSTNAMLPSFLIASKVDPVVPTLCCVVRHVVWLFAWNHANSLPWPSKLQSTNVIRISSRSVSSTQSGEWQKVTGKSVLLMLSSGDFCTQKLIVKMTLVHIGLNSGGSAYPIWCRIVSKRQAISFVSHCS